MSNLEHKILTVRDKSLWSDIFLLFILTIGFFWRVLFENKYLFFGANMAQEFYPVRLYANWMLKGLQLPLLDPFTAGPAIPFIARAQAAVFYPLNLILALIPNVVKDINLGFRVLEYQFAFHFFLAACFTYLLARIGLRLNRAGSAFSAIVFAFGGLLVTHVLDFAFVYSVIWMPLVLLFFIKGLDKRNLFLLALAGLVLGVSMLSGNLQGSLYTGFILILYLIYLFIYERDIKRSFLLRGIVTTFVVAFGISSIQLLPAYFLNPDAFASTPSYIQLSRRTDFLLSFLMPSFHRLEWGWWEVKIYLGILPLILALLTILLLRKNRSVRFFLGLLVFSFLLTLILCKDSILLRWYYRMVPQLGFFNYPTRLRLLSNFAIAILAGLGIDCFSKSMNKTLEKLYQRYSRWLLVCFIGILSILPPIFFARLITRFDYPSLIKINAIFWFLLLFGLGVVIFQLRLSRNGRILAFLIILLTVIDIFSFWATFHPGAYGYAPSHEIISPVNYYRNTGTLDLLRFDKDWHKYPLPISFKLGMSITLLTLAALITAGWRHRVIRRQSKMVEF